MQPKAKKELFKGLRKLLKTLHKDLLNRANQVEARKGLKEQWSDLCECNRCATSFKVWLDQYLEQIAVAWIMTIIFVRYLEDNRYILQRIAKSGEDYLLSMENRAGWLRKNSGKGYADYFIWIFQELSQTRIGAIFKRENNILYQFHISSEAADEVWRLFRLADQTNKLNHDFSAENGDTRLLGDLYQDLSEMARKKYALLQTPDFVEEFLLDRSLMPAMKRVGHNEVTMIDPTCGSGHLVIGGFHRILDAKKAAYPNDPIEKLVEETLKQVHGVDINPFAVQIARFRLLFAAFYEIRKVREKDERLTFKKQKERALSLGDNPPQEDEYKYLYKLELLNFDNHEKVSLLESEIIGGINGPQIAIGNSLLSGKLHKQVSLWDLFDSEKEDPNDLSKHYPKIRSHFTEEEKALQILSDTYDVVVGNPPYIVVKDKALNQAYRQYYNGCHRKYALVVPFFERFFDLAKNGNDAPEAAGYVAMIVANSFMKREFGTKMVRNVIPNYDLTEVIDTSGAFIPGHSTPTIILVGRMRKPTSDQVFAALGIRGEPSTPKDPRNGKVWKSITENVDKQHFENDYITIKPLDRALLHIHPWTIKGGGALEILDLLHLNSTNILLDIINKIGFMAITGEDNFFVSQTCKNMKRKRIPSKELIEFGIGRNIRDWNLQTYCAIRPIIDKKRNFSSHLIKYSWLYRTNLSSTLCFGKTKTQRDMYWLEYVMIMKDRLFGLSISFAFVATHNHFVLDHGGKVFKQSAPVIKLFENATEADHLGLLGLLNSSIAAFWLRMACQGKELSSEEFLQRLEYDSTKLKRFPIPTDRPLLLATLLDQAASRRAKFAPELHIDGPPKTLNERLDAASNAQVKLDGFMIALQEELDWQVYRIYGLLDKSDFNELDEVWIEKLPKVKLGERAFEIVLARKIKRGDIETAWFTRHGSSPITEIPTHWPNWYQDRVRQRIEWIEGDFEAARRIRFLEQPEYKRRWNTPSWQKREKEALWNWMLDRIESPNYVPAADREETELRVAINPEVVTMDQLYFSARKDNLYLAAAMRFEDDILFNEEKMIKRLIESCTVPALAADRYTESGLVKRRVWEEVWRKQRLEDAIDASSETEAIATKRKKEEIGDIPVPPSYKRSDFKKGIYWTLRGKLDVPKERFLSYSGASSFEDTDFFDKKIHNPFKLVLTWAGLDYKQQAGALLQYYYPSKEDGLPKKNLIQMLASMHALTPWLRQYYNEIEPMYGYSFAQKWSQIVTGEMFDLETDFDLLDELAFAKKPFRKF